MTTFVHVLTWLAVKTLRLQLRRYNNKEMFINNENNKSLARFIDITQKSRVWCKTFVTIVLHQTLEMKVDICANTDSREGNFPKINMHSTVLMVCTRNYKVKLYIQPIYSVAKEV